MKGRIFYVRTKGCWGMCIAAGCIHKVLSCASRLGACVSCFVHVALYVTPTIGGGVCIAAIYVDANESCKSSWHLCFLRCTCGIPCDSDNSGGDVSQRVAFTQMSRAIPLGARVLSIVHVGIFHVTDKRVWGCASQHIAYTPMTGRFGTS